jgi:hypothetical protein
MWGIYCLSEKQFLKKLPNGVDFLTGFIPQNAFLLKLSRCQSSVLITKCESLRFLEDAIGLALAAVYVE